MGRLKKRLIVAVMGKRKMANRKKSGIQICLAALFLCTSLLGQVLTADRIHAAAAGTGMGTGAGVPGNGAAGAADAGSAAGTGVPAAGAADAAVPGNGAAGAADAAVPGNGAAGAAVPGNEAAGAADAAVPGNGAAGAADAGNAGSAVGGVSNTRAEAGIIEVLSGFEDAKGKFWKMKSGSGFLIANKESATYIVTNCSNVSNTPRKIKKFCKKNSIDTENMQLVNTIRVVITGDVTAEAEVVVKSAEKDYCILSAANVVSQKESLKLGDSAGVTANDLVCAYGFPEQAGTGEDLIQYSEMDVRAIQGAVTQTEAYLEGGVYLAHSAPVVPGCAGGPLLDADGYVIGLSCRLSPEDDTGIAYALPINEISAVLDNFSIYYGSRAIDEAAVQLAAVYKECMDIQAAGGYKKASMDVLAQALESAEEVMAIEEPYPADLIGATQSLIAAKGALEPKTAALLIAIIVMGVLDLILFIWMLITAVKNAQEKKQMDLQRVQPAMQGAGYAHMPQNPGNRQALANAGSKRQAPQGAAYPGQAPQGAGYPRPQAAGRQLQGADQFRRPVAPPAGRRIKLLRQKTGQTVVLNKNQFIVGKSQTLADYCIADNQTISRKHAMLFEDAGIWYIDDLSSLNGTCVNGKKVVPGQAVRLRSGDEITLSDEEFLVQD